jgi:hypothetical protein
MLTVPRSADGGAWYAEVTATDQAGNAPPLPYSPDETLSVTSAPADVTGPALTSFAINPTAISDGAGPKPVVCTMGVADAASGSITATCAFNIFVFAPPDIVNQSQSCTATSPTSGTRNSGTFQCNAQHPALFRRGLLVVQCHAR